MILIVRTGRVFADVSTTMQEAALFYGAAALKSDRAWVAADATGNLLSLRVDAPTIIGGSCWIVGTRGGRSQMGDILRDWVARSDASNTDVRSFACLAEGVVA